MGKLGLGGGGGLVNLEGGRMNSKEFRGGDLVKVVGMGGKEDRRGYKICGVTEYAYIIDMPYEYEGRKYTHRLINESCLEKLKEE